jgi:hypothetical protein
MWARGSFAVPAAADMMIPVRPWEARKQAREAPAGPAPTMRYGVSMRGIWLGSEGVEWPLGRVVEAMIEILWVLVMLFRPRGVLTMSSSCPRVPVVP